MHLFEINSHYSNRRLKSIIFKVIISLQFINNNNSVFYRMSLYLLFVFANVNGRVYLGAVTLSKGIRAINVFK